MIDFFSVIWSILIVLQVVLSIKSFRSETDLPLKYKYPLATASMISLEPLVTHLFFFSIFIIGGSSNVAQLNLSEDGDLSGWNTWFRIWPVLFALNPIAFILLVILAIIPPYPPSHWRSFGARALAIASAGFACYAVFTFFPTA